MNHWCHIIVCLWRILGPTQRSKGNLRMSVHGRGAQSAAFLYSSISISACCARWERHTVALRLRRSDEDSSRKHASLYRRVFTAFTPEFIDEHSDETATLLNIAQWIHRTAFNQVCTRKTTQRSPQTVACQVRSDRERKTIGVTFVNVLTRVRVVIRSNCVYVSFCCWKCVFCTTAVWFFWSFTWRSGLNMLGFLAVVRRRKLLTPFSYSVVFRRESGSGNFTGWWRRPAEKCFGSFVARTII